MKTQDAINYFGSSTALAKALGITVSAVTQWGNYGCEYPPDLRQLQLERMVESLKAEPGCLERLLGLNK